MVDINLRSVAAVTSLGGGLTLKNHCMHFDFPQLSPLPEHSYQNILKYLEEKLTHRRLNRKIALDMYKIGLALQ